jgi:hypothetical protein
MGKITHGCLGHSAYGILFWQPTLTKFGDHIFSHTGTSLEVGGAALGTLCWEQHSLERATMETL